MKRQKQRKIRLFVRCPSWERRIEIAAIAEKLTRLDRVIANTVLSFPGGTERREVRRYRLRDYFDRIYVSDENQGSGFVIGFAPSQDADRYWRDLMVQIASSLRREGAEVEVMREEAPCS